MGKASKRIANAQADVRLFDHHPARASTIRKIQRAERIRLELRPKQFDVPTKREVRIEQKRQLREAKGLTPIMGASRGRLLYDWLLARLG